MRKVMTRHQGRAQEGAKVARATANCPPRLKLPLRRKYIFFLNSITDAELHVGLDKIIAGRGGRGCSGGKKLTCCPFFPGQSNCPSKFLCSSLLCCATHVCT